MLYLKSNFKITYHKNTCISTKKSHTVLVTKLCVCSVKMSKLTQFQASRALLGKHEVVTSFFRKNKKGHEGHLSHVIFHGPTAQNVDKQTSPLQRQEAKAIMWWWRIFRGRNIKLHKIYIVYYILSFATYLWKSKTNFVSVLRHGRS